MGVASGTDQAWKVAKRVGGVAGDRMSIRPSVEVGTSVCATLSAVAAAAGEPVMNCLSALLPAEATVSTPRRVAASTAAERSSSNGCPYTDPSDMLMMST